MSIAFYIDGYTVSVGKSRICKLESDCRSIPNTTCIADVQDGKTRCLCGDYSAPVNGACTNIHKGKTMTVKIDGIEEKKKI